jgi:hypothetical protein
LAESSSGSRSAPGCASPRRDLRPELLRQESAPALPSGQGTSPMSDREFDEAAEKAHAVAVVKLAARALVTPLELLAMGLALFGVARFVKGQPNLRALMVLTAHAGLPHALKNLLSAAAALRRVQIVPGEVATLVPLPWGAAEGPPLMRLLAHLNPFALLALVIIAVGLPHATGMSRSKATVTVGVCFLLQVLLTL